MIPEPPATQLQPAVDFWREARGTYAFPLTMFALAIVPGVNFIYSGHGGPVWLVLPLCAPYILLRAALRIIRSLGETRSILLKFYAATIPGYVALAYPLSWAATTSLRRTFGLEITTWEFMKLMISPYPYWYFS